MSTPELAGRRALITGAAGGLGRAMAQRFHAAGARLLLADRSAAAVRTLAGELGADHAVLDVADEAGVTGLLEQCARDGSTPDTLVHCAGITAGRDFLALSAQEWRHMLDINLTGSFLVAQAVARCMAVRGGGSIVLIASVTGERATHGRSAYACSKAGVIMLTRAMAVELAPFGIRVNALAPGAFETPLVTQHHTGESAFIRPAYTAQTPMARYGTADELAPAAVFLASDAARYITGAVLPVDGGYLAAGMLRPHAVQATP